jgi:restriction endonuclease S subunit
LDGKITIEESERKISEIALNEVNLTLMPKQSIVLSTRAPVGYLVVITKESTFNQGCKGLIPKDINKVNPYYYCYYLSSKKYMLQNKAGQSTFKELSTKLPQPI